jgi:hypothetical protein
MQLSQPIAPQPKLNTISIPTDSDLADLLQTTLCIDIDTQTLHDYATIKAAKTAPTIKNDSDDNLYICTSFWKFVQNPPKHHTGKQLHKVLGALMKERKKTLYMRPFYGYKPHSTLESLLPSTKENTVALVQSLRKLNTSQPIQRTKKWYEMRKKRITASEFYKVFRYRLRTRNVRF